MSVHKAWGQFVAKVTLTRARANTHERTLRKGFGSSLEVPEEPVARRMSQNPYSQKVN